MIKNPIIIWSIIYRENINIDAQVMTILKK